MASALKICFAASEVQPFVKTGGLADVAGALPRELFRLGHDVRLFLPLYGNLDPCGQSLWPVDFARNVGLQLGPRTYTFSLYTANAPGTELAVYFIDCPELYHRSRIYTDDPDEPQRFAFFSRAVIESCQRMGFAPDVFHCNDWHTALIPLLLRTVYDWDGLFRGSRTLLTLHNIGYQGVFGAGAIDAIGLRPWEGLFDQQELQAGRVNFLRTGLLYAHALSTVSPTYAREILGDELGMGLQGLLRLRRPALVGILNGVDYEEWNPAADPLLPVAFSTERLEGKRANKRHLLRELGLPDDPDPPCAGIISRFVPQKGLDLCFDVLPEALAHTALRLTVLGSGDRQYEDFFSGLQRGFPRQVCYYRGYSNELAHRIEAGCDMFLMPSRYEPCGLNQMFSLRYGTIPIVRATGGLADSVDPFDADTGRGTGFAFRHFTPDGLRWALSLALQTYADPPRWERLVRNAMAQDFSWTTSARRYVQLYSRLPER